MYSFKEVKKAAKMLIDGKPCKMAVLGNCATQFFSVSIQGYARLSGIALEVFDADYNQIDAQLLDPESEVYGFKPDYILLWLATDKLYEEFLDMPIADRASFAELTIQKLEYYWNLVEQNSKARILQPNFTEIDDRALGNYSCKVRSSFIYQIRKLNYLLQEKMENRKDIFPIDLLSVQIRHGNKLFYDAPLYYNAKMTIALNMLPYVAKCVVDVILAMNGKIKKCVVCDLDNTLWGGVIGDDGLGGIEIGELGRGHSFANFQRWLKQLKECGIILAVCSKNNENIAKEPFEKHDEMILRLSDISVFVANWNDKASNIKMIQETLNIGMDSIVFIDDNPFERNLVKTIISEIEVPDLPEDPALYLEYLQECNYFETASFTGVNSDRTKQYQAEYERRQLQMSYSSIDDYLISLEMVGEAKAFEPVRYSRIAQLTQRSNQFNLRTVRYTEDEIEKIANSDHFITLYYTLKDKFGDHGLVSVVIMEKVSEEELFVDTWLMSCRVLKRGMEEFIVNKFVDVAKKAGYKIIKSEYLATAKNAMVKDIYKTMGFIEIEDGKYILEIDNYQVKTNYIKENE
ncbi:MAG: HAD-IIIC family phosphatase [Lachnospiraceae bacterium]